jgi:SAM-dependent methyltransferase
MVVEERNDALAGGYKDPVERYKFAIDCMTQGVDWVADVGCGCGYGTWVIWHADVAPLVVGMDNSLDAIKYAEGHYPGPMYYVGDAHDHTWPRFDMVVCLEAMSHFTDPWTWLAGLEVPRIVVSAPLIPSTNVYKYRKHDIAPADYRAMVAERWNIRGELEQRGRYLTLYGVR